MFKIVVQTLNVPLKSILEISNNVTFLDNTHFQKDILETMKSDFQKHFLEFFIIFINKIH